MILKYLKLIVSWLLNKEQPQELKFVSEGGFGYLFSQEKEDLLNYTTEQKDDIERFNRGISCSWCELQVINKTTSPMHYVGCVRAKRIWNI